MGLLLLDAAFEHARRVGLNHAATRLLLYMARVAYDPDNSKGVAPCRFFESRSKLAQGLGCTLPDRKPDDSASPTERAAWTAGNSKVKRALEELIQAGAIKRTHAGSPGWNAEYLVTVSAVDVALLGTGERSPRGTGERSGWGPVSGPAGDRSPVPLTQVTQVTPTSTEPRAPAPSHVLFPGRSAEDEMRAAS